MDSGSVEPRRARCIRTFVRCTSADRPVPSPSALTTLRSRAAAAIKDGAHPLSVIFKIVTPTGVDTRRWVDGLRFARKQGVAPKGLVPFLKANGGISGCERQFHAQK